MPENNCKFALKRTEQKRPSDESAESSLGWEELRYKPQTELIQIC